MLALAWLVPRHLPAADDLAPAAGRFLVADRGMGDPRFARTVILLVDYSADGALGLIVNRPTLMSLAHAFPDRGSDAGKRGVLWFGGPVAMNSASMLLDTTRQPEGARRVFSSVHYSNSRELLDSMLGSDPDSRFRVYSGYAGWSPGQLDSELARGDWRVKEARVEQVFPKDGEGLWRLLIGDRGTWVQRPPAGSRVLPVHLQRRDGGVGSDAGSHPHGTAAHGAVLHVVRVAGRAVHRQLHGLPAVGAGGGDGLEHVR